MVSYQVPQHRKNLRKLSEDVLKGLLDLEKFYNERGHILDGSPEFRVALENLSS
jgi:hypothetical protein